MLRFRNLWWLVLCFSLLTHAEERPRIALVLSGGGARGIAHVGVLKVLEENRIPVDCVVGTSMGAIVGGAYATGMPASEMRGRIEHVNWDRMFADRADRRFIPYFRKRDDWQDYFDFTMNIRDFRIMPPENLIGVQNVGLFFRDLVGTTAAMPFDQLPIPYRAVGTDLETGDAVVMSEGDLPLVMRASMTVPGAFPLIEYKGRVVVDGGLTKNLPIDEGRRLCGDHVIAVNVSTPGVDKGALHSVFAISQQVVTLAVQRDTKQQTATLGSKDTLITPDLKSFDSADFDRAGDLIDRGEEAARAALPGLLRYQLSPEDYAKWRAAVDSRKRPPPRIKHVRIEPTRWANTAVTSSLLAIQKNEPLDQHALHDNIQRIYARGDFERVSYSIWPYEDGAELDVRPMEKPGRDFARVGVELETNFSELSTFEVKGAMRRMWVNSWGAEWRSEGQIGETRRVFTELYQPTVLNGEFFVAPQAYYLSHPRDIVLDSQRVAQLEVTDIGTAFDLGSILGKWGELRAGMVERHVNSEIGSASEFKSYQNAYNGSGYRIQATYDQMDDTKFPHHGSLVRWQWYDSSAGLGADRNYRRLDFDARRALLFGSNTLLLDLRTGSSQGTQLPDSESFFLGGLMNLSAYRRDELVGNQMMLTRVTLYRQVDELPAGIGHGVYAGILLEGGKTSSELGYNSDIFKHWRTSSSAVFAADTRLGPLYLVLSQGDRDHRAAYLALGISY